MVIARVIVPAAIAVVVVVAIAVAVAIAVVAVVKFEARRLCLTDLGVHYHYCLCA